MRIIVTGSSGKLGRHVVAHLAAHGHEVIGVDREPGAGVTVRAELTDYGQVAQVLSATDDRYSGVDAVVHLGAIPAPGLVPDAQVFSQNVLASYNVFTAALRTGIRRLVWASSETLLGLPLSETPPPRLPVDEEYVVRPQSSYSLGKAVDEEVSRHLARWYPDATIVGLRFSNVMDDSDYARFETWQDDPGVRAWNAWGYIDARDGAQAVRRALEVDITGFEAFIIAADDTVMRRPSAELAELFTGVPLARPIEGRGTLLSIDKARRMLGYAPEYRWQERLAAASNR